MLCVEGCVGMCSDVCPSVCVVVGLTASQGDEAVIGYLRYCREQGYDYKTEIEDQLQVGQRKHIIARLDITTRQQGWTPRNRADGVCSVVVMLCYRVVCTRTRSVWRRRSRRPNRRGRGCPEESSHASTANQSISPIIAD